MVNGTEDLPMELSADEWDSILWSGPEREVARLRQRIFKAAQGRGLAEGQESAEADCATRRPVISPV
jgi:hypothetical protein